MSYAFRAEVERRIMQERADNMEALATTHDMTEAQMRVMQGRIAEATTVLAIINEVHRKIGDA